MMNLVKSRPPDLQEFSADDQAMDERNLIASQLLLYEDKYTESKTIEVVCASFNVNQKRPAPGPELRKWLRVDGDYPPDIVAIGLQEVDMSAGAMLREETPAVTPWRIAFSEALAGQWECVDARQLVGLYLTVFVKKSLRAAVDCVETSVVRCGAMGNQMANKGGVGIRLHLHRTTFAFVTAHLAAHMSEWAKRNRDFTRIVDQMNFKAGRGTSVFLKHTDRVFFFGDLNYRIELPYDEACSLVVKEDWEKLLERDQLRLQFRRPDGPYANYQEAVPAFAPTYKYDSGSTRYDTSEKKRIPAWTDRVLWSVGHDNDGKETGKEISLQSFWREELMQSDHRPVAALFKTEVRFENAEQKSMHESFIREKMAQVGKDKFASPCIEMKRSKIDFGSVAFGDGPVEQLHLKNNGHAVVLVSVHSDTRGGFFSGGKCVMSNNWLSVSPLELRLYPDKEAVVSVQCCIDQEAVTPIYEEGPFRAPPDDSSLPSLASSLVITAGQVRLWVTCEAQVRPSCFGARLDHLSVCGLVPAAQAYLLPLQHQRPPPTRPTIPKEIWHMVDYIIKNGATTPELFSDDELVNFQDLRDLLDRHPDQLPEKKDWGAKCVAQALLAFLCNLQVPVIPPHCHEQCLMKNWERAPAQAAQQVVQDLPAVHYNVFHYTIGFLRFLLRPENREKNLLTDVDLASTFGPALLQRPTASATPEERVRERAAARDFTLCYLR